MMVSLTILSGGQQGPTLAPSSNADWSSAVRPDTKSTNPDRRRAEDSGDSFGDQLQAALASSPPPQYDPSVSSSPSSTPNQDTNAASAPTSPSTGADPSAATDSTNPQASQTQPATTQEDQPHSGSPQDQATGAGVSPAGPTLSTISGQDVKVQAAENLSTGAVSPPQLSDGQIPVPPKDIDLPTNPALTATPQKKPQPSEEQVAQLTNPTPTTSSYSSKDAPGILLKVPPSSHESSAATTTPPSQTPLFTQTLQAPATPPTNADASAPSCSAFADQVLFQIHSLQTGPTTLSSPGVDLTTPNGSTHAAGDRQESAGTTPTNSLSSTPGVAPATVNLSQAAQASESATHASVTDQVGQAIVAHADIATSEGRVDFRLRLEPPELGTVNVHLTLTNQGLSAHLTVQEGSARQLIQGQLESLRQRLQEMGVGVGQLDVSGGGGGSGRQSQTPSSGSLAPLTSEKASTTTQTSTVASLCASTSCIDVMA